jgi:monoamine oxidase
VRSNVDVDFVVVGAGAAGLSAARTFGSASRRCLVIEAASQIGGRCITRTSPQGLAYDVGAHFLHMPELNPLFQLGAQAGFTMYAAPEDYWLQFNRREASAREYAAFDAGWERLEASIYAHATEAHDVGCATVVPRDLGRWQHTIEFVVGPYLCGRDLDEVSAHDFATSDEREIDGFCREGFGTLLARLGDGLDVRLDTSVRRIADGSGGALTVETDRGVIRAGGVLVTVSTAVLASGAITFAPRLADDVLEACAGLPLGDYERIVMVLEDDPLEAEDDILVVPCAQGPDTGAMLVRVGGTDLAMLDVGGRHARALVEAGADAGYEFARQWLRATFGNYAADAMRPIEATAWSQMPFVRGAFSSARPGMADGRRRLREAGAGGRLRFAGEALHPSLWGTVAGAWESGAAAALALIEDQRKP